MVKNIVKELSALILTLLGSLLILYGCGDPYKKLKLSVDTSSIVLYLNEQDATEDDEETNTSQLSSSAFFSVTLSGTSKNMNTGVDIKQTAYYGVEDIVDIEEISSDTTSKKGALYKVTAKRAGRGYITVSSKEGDKSATIEVMVYLPVKTINFDDQTKAVKYGSSLKLIDYIDYYPLGTNQQDIDFYISDTMLSPDDGTLTNTSYASIIDGVLYSKNSSNYPTSNGERYISVYGISKFSPKIRTAVINIPVLEIIDPSEIVLTSNTENGEVDLTKSSNGNYEIVLGHNIYDNQNIFERNLYVKLSDIYTTDQKYSISTNYVEPITTESIFQLDDKVEDIERFNYTGLATYYPYKLFNFSQLKVGSDILEIYIDRRGYEGLFTITLKVKVTVKEFPTSLSLLDENNNEIGEDGLTIFNAYGNGILGTQVNVKLTNNADSTSQIKLEIIDAPELEDTLGITITQGNNVQVSNGGYVYSGTTVFLKHDYNIEQIMEEIINAEVTPILKITYIYTLAPSNVSSEGYYEYVIEKEIPLNIKLGVTDLRIPYDSTEIKVNAVTGKAIQDNQGIKTNGFDSTHQAILEEETNDEIVLVTIDDLPADLVELISTIEIVSVNDQSSTLDAMDNKYFSLSFPEYFSVINGYSLHNRLVLEPKKQAEQANIVLKISTTNNITKFITINIFIPIAYNNNSANSINLEIYNENDYRQYIYETSKHYPQVRYSGTIDIIEKGDYVASEDDGTIDIVKYTTLDSITISTGGKIGFNVYNYIVLENVGSKVKLSKINYNSNISIAVDRAYCTLDYENIDGISVPFITAKNSKANTKLTFTVSGYNNEGVKIEFKKEVTLVIIEPLTSISLTPENPTIYVADSLGVLKQDASIKTFNVETYPRAASIPTLSEDIDLELQPNIVDYRIEEKVLYSLAGRTRNFQITTNQLVKLQYCSKEEILANKNNALKVSVQAILDIDAIEAILREYSLDTGITLDSNTIIRNIFANNVVVTLIASLNQYSNKIITSTPITIRYAEKVEKIIPNIDEKGINFDARDITSNNIGKSITFNVLPSTAFNKTLIVYVDNNSVAQIVSGVDSNNRLVGNTIVIKPSTSAGRTYIRIASEDCYVLDPTTLVPIPTSYLDISVRVSDGSKEFPFEINDVNGFMRIAEDIAEGNNKYYYVLTSSISLVGSELSPFGEFAGGLDGKFTYSTDGVYFEQQNTIYDLNIALNNNSVLTLDNSVDEYNIGLFSKLSQSAEINNLYIDNASINLKLVNENYLGKINIGIITGINTGSISNSKISGNINVTSDTDNVNIGGLVGKNLTSIGVTLITDINGSTSSNITTYGTITGNKNNNSNDVVNAEIAINFKGTEKLERLYTSIDGETISNINLGGIAGVSRTYLVNDKNGDIAYIGAPLDSDEEGSGFNIYEYVTNNSIRTISGLRVVPSISSSNHEDTLLPSNIGGVVGLSDSSTISETEVLPTLLQGYSNVGGIIGYANGSLIKSSTVEFVNHNQVGTDTISIFGYNNIGGLVGYGKNLHIAYSYVRSYFNNQSIDNDKYYGNMMLLASDIDNANIGGLVGRLDSANISQQLFTKGSILGFDINNINSNSDSQPSDINEMIKYVVNDAACAISYSYFNADINYQNSDNNFVSGMVGYASANEKVQVIGGITTVDALKINNSYIYGNIFNDEKLYTVTNYVPQQEDVKADFTSGNFIYYAVGKLTLDSSYNNHNYKEADTINAQYKDYISKVNTADIIRCEVKTTNNGKDIDDKSYYIQTIEYKVSKNVFAFIGNSMTTYSEDVKDKDSEVSNIVYKTDTEGNPTDVVVSQTETTRRYHSIGVSYGRSREIINSYSSVNSQPNLVVNATNSGIQTLFNIEITEKGEVEFIIDNLVDPPTTTKITTMTTTDNVSYVDLTKLSSYPESFLIIKASTNNQDYEGYNWLLCEEINGGLPVIFKSTATILFKLLPTNITLNILPIDNALKFNNLCYIKDNDNLILFYNEPTEDSTRYYYNINKYRIVLKEDQSLSQGYPLNAISVDLDIVDLYDKYGITATYSKGMNIVSSNENIVKVTDNSTITTVGTGEVTLTISSYLDSNISKSIKILVVEGVSDFNLYKTSVTTDRNKFNEYEGDFDPEFTLNSITQVVDKTNNYWLDVVNTDSSTFTEYSGTYTKNNNIGAIIEVSDSSTGRATINGIDLIAGQSYIFSQVGNFSFKGNKEGMIFITITPFIKTNNSNFGTTIDTLQNCVIINQLSKKYLFNVVPKAESITTDKSSASLDPVYSTDLSISTITSNFTYNSENYNVNEVIYVKITDLSDGSLVAYLPLEVSDEGYNNSLVNITLNSQSVKETDNELKIKLIHSLSLSFNDELYKDRTNGDTFNINNLKYLFEFYPDSNKEIIATFNLTIVPRQLTEIKMSYYANSEITADGSFNPQETSSEYIVPSRVGMLKMELNPNYSNAEYIRLSVDGDKKSNVVFDQKVAVMSGDETSYITGYANTSRRIEYLPNYEGVKLINESALINGSTVIFNNWYYVTVLLSSDAVMNDTIKFIATGYRTQTDSFGNTTEIEVLSQEFELVVQPLPSVTLTVNGKSEGLINKGDTVELEINAENFEGDIEITSTTEQGNSQFVIQEYDIETGKHYVTIDKDAIGGDTLVITAIASRYINGLLESHTSTVRLYIVEYTIENVNISGSAYLNGAYQIETINGTTLPLQISLTTSGNNIKNVKNLISDFERVASGISYPSDGSQYINNWMRKNDIGDFESLYPNTDYKYFNFVELIMSDFSMTHYFALKTTAVNYNLPDAEKDVVRYVLRYYYDGNGIPQLYTDINYGYTVYEINIDVMLVIKDNSTYDHPNPIATAQEFMALGGMDIYGNAIETSAVTDGHYILVNDITFNTYFPFEANFYSLDGNGYVITINSINTTKYKDGSIANVGLFEKVSSNTVIKNLVVDVSNMLITSTLANNIMEDTENQLEAKIDLRGVQSLNFGVIAGENNGSITNSKVINTKTTNINNNTNKILLVATTAGYLNGGLIDARIGGLVGVNNGVISNSYVGLNSYEYDSLLAENKNAASSLELRGRTDNTSYMVNTYPFNIIGGNSISGFVNANYNIIANSYVLGVGVINSGEIFEGTTTAGFVINNDKDGVIFNCMVEGLQTFNYRASESQVFLKGKGNLGGFVYSNSGSISNAYSNIPITTNSGGSGGFVYVNESTGTITNSYSTAKNALNSWAHGQFTGIDDDSEYCNYGTYTSCFYLVMESESENASEPALAIMGKDVSNAVMDEDSQQENDNPFRDTGSFNGFNFTTGNDTSNIWQISSKSMHFGPRIVSISSMKTFSHRVLSFTTTDSVTNTTEYNYEYESTYYYGSDDNPLLVNSASEFVTFIINNSKQMSINGKTFNVFGVSNTNTVINMPHYVRLINNLDFSTIALNNMLVDGKHISDITFVGKLDGNGMTMSGLRLVDQNQSYEHENFGLFYQIGLSNQQKEYIIETSGTDNTVVSGVLNLNIGILGIDSSQGIKVGTLAGSIYNTSLININITGKNGVYIRGQNLVGGLAGLIINEKESIIDVTTNNISVTASHSSVNGNVNIATKLNPDGTINNQGSSQLIYKSYMDLSDTDRFSISRLRDLSYAGSIAGVIDADNRLDENIISRIYNDDNEIINDLYSIGYSEEDPDGSNYKINITGNIAQYIQEYSQGDITQYRTKPKDDIIARLTSKGGGYIAAEHAGGLFGGIAKNTHVKNSKYLVGEIKEENSTDSSEDTESAKFVQEIRGYNYAGGIVGENYGMLEKVYVEHLPTIQEKLDSSLGANTNLADENTKLFGESTEIAIGGIAGFSSDGIILDSYNKVKVMNTQAKAAGGIIGIATNNNYLSHIYITSSVLGGGYLGGVIGLVPTTTSPKQYRHLIFDYVFALNYWNSDVKNIMYDNMWLTKNNYRLDKSSVVDHNFTVVLPEIGNKMGNNEDIQIIDTNTDGVYTYLANVKNDIFALNTYAGSLIGYTNPEYVDKSRIVHTASNITSLGEKIEYLYSTVISTTFNDGSVLNNEIYKKVDDDPANIGNDRIWSKVVEKETREVTDEHGITTGNNNFFTSFPSYNPSQVRDQMYQYMDQYTTIGNQIKFGQVAPKDLTNNLFNMFKWDCISTESNLMQESDSKVWKLEGVLPEYIIGIYSNFVKIENAPDFIDKLSNKKVTRNQYFLITQDIENLKAIEMSSGGASLDSNTFEGVIIGSQKNVDGVMKNPVIKFESTSMARTIFDEFDGVTIMNVDFEINLNYNTLQSTAYAGYLVNRISSSVLTNVTITINTNYDEFTINNAIQGLGLVCGRAVDSTFQNVTLIYKGVDTEINSNENSELINNLSVGGIIGESIRCTLNNNYVYTKGGSIKLNNIIYKINNNVVNIGSIFGKGTNNKLSSVNSNSDINNNIFTFGGFDTNGKFADIKLTLNFGGLFGYIVSSQVTDASYIGNIDVNNNSIGIVNLRAGAIAGYSENTAFEHVNVNDRLYYDSDNETLLEDKKNHKINIVNSNTSITYIGGILGYGVNSKVYGNANNSLNSSNISNINATINNVKEEVAVGGIVGAIRNSSDSLEVSRLYNLGDVNVNVGILESKAVGYVGGIVGEAIGGKYESIINSGDITFTSNSGNQRYSLGSILGASLTTAGQNAIKLTKFINFGDIYIKALRPSKAAARYAGGVAGKCEGIGSSSFEGGYTLARVMYYNEYVDGNYVQLGVKNQDNSGINGIAYIANINESSFVNVFFVYDFLPYSNFTNQNASGYGAKTLVSGDNESCFGGVEYADLVVVLNTKLRNYFSINTSHSSDVSFVYENTDGSTHLALPYIFKKDNSNEVVEMVDAMSMIEDLANTGAKLNPELINSTSDKMIASDKYYIITSNAIGDKTITITLSSGDSFSGLITSVKADSSSGQKVAVPYVELKGITNNFGFISNIKSEFKVDSMTDTQNAIVLNNYGNMYNCIVYGVVTNNISTSNDVAMIAYNNAGNITQCGATVMFKVTSIQVGNVFTGFVANNLYDGFIKDCYSTVSVINTSLNVSADWSNIFRNNPTISGFVSSNGGTIETSYFAGSIQESKLLNAGINIFVYNNTNNDATGIIRNCYYDAEAMPITKPSNVKELTSIGSRTNYSNVEAISTKDMLATGTDSIKSFSNICLTTTFVPISNFNLAPAYMYNYGYPTLSGKDKINTIDDRNYLIYHAGQINNIDYLKSSAYNFSVISNIDMSKVNYISNKGIYKNFATLDTGIVFDGNSHILYNLKINSSVSNLGLFAYNYGTIRNIVLDKVDISGGSSENVGAIVANNSGTINNIVVRNESKINTGSANNVGLLVGNASGGEISNIIINDGNTVIGKSNVGGIIGFIENGKVENVTINKITISATSAIGGAIGRVKGTAVISNITLQNNSNITTKGNGAKDDKDVIRNGVTFGEIKSDYNGNRSIASTKYSFNESNAINNIKSTNAIDSVGGIVGVLENGTLTDNFVRSTTITGIKGLGGLVGYASGGNIKFNSNQTYVEGVTLDGKFNIGGLVGYNQASISGGSAIISAYVGNGANNTNLAIGGIAGYNSGVIDNIVVQGSTINGARLFGGITGYSENNKVINCSVLNTTLNYNSKIDIDGFEGDMGDINLGISNTSQFSNNYNSYFGMSNCGIFNWTNGPKCANEYGGIDLKVGGNKQIMGKEDFKLYFGFINGYGSVGNNCSSSNSTVKGIYDKFFVYIAHVYGWWWGPGNACDIARYTHKGTRYFEMNSSAGSAYYTGSNTYRKYNGNFETVSRQFSSSISSGASSVALNGQDIYKAFKDANHVIASCVYPGLTLARSEMGERKNYANSTYKTGWFDGIGTHYFDAISFMYG